MLVILALRSLREKDLKFKANLIYLAKHYLKNQN